MRWRQERVMKVYYILHRLRILLFLAIFYYLAVYESMEVALVLILYVIMSDLSDIETEINELKKERTSWKSFLTKRGDF
jgi:hypothetical protein